jgi:magnesium transporter
MLSPIFLYQENNVSYFFVTLLPEKKTVIVMKKQHKKRRAISVKKSNNLLYEHLIYQGSNDVSTVIELTCFDDNNLSRKTVQRVDELQAAMNKNAVNWVHVKGLNNVQLIGELCGVFGVQRLLVQDVLNAKHIAKIEENNGHLFAVMDIFNYNDEQDVLVSEHLSFILGDYYVLSFQETSDNRFELIHKALAEKLGRVRTQQSDYLFNLLISNVVDGYLEVLEIQQNLMLDMEEQMMEFLVERKELSRNIQTYRRDYLMLKKAIWPVKEQFSHLLMMGSKLIEKETHIYYKDTYDHLTQANMMVEACREMISSLLDLYLANNDLRMNHIMKRLTVMSTIFIPLTFLVGVWGMNFRFMPEIEWKYGYLFAWGIIVLVGLIVYLYMRKRKWY